MINPFKDVEDISKLYRRNSSTPVKNSEDKIVTNIYSKCKPDMDWIYNECMMQSKKYREMLEANIKVPVMIEDPLVQKDPLMKAKYQKRILRSYDWNYNDDVRVMTPVFNQCALLYQENCRKFYETFGQEEELKFQME